MWYRHETRAAPPTAGDGSRAILDGLERAKAHRRAKVEHPFPVIKQQFGLEKTRLPGQATNHCKMMVMAALPNLFLSRKRLVAMAAAWHHRSSVTTHCFSDARDQQEGCLRAE